MNIKELIIGLTLSLVLSVSVNVNAYGSSFLETLAKKYCDGLATSVRRSEDFDDELAHRRKRQLSCHSHSGRVTHGELDLRKQSKRYSMHR